jgi:hypothetical protein
MLTNGRFLRAPFLHQRKLQVPRLPPDFLSDLVVSVNLMRLSLRKAAYVVVLRAPRRKSGVRSGMTKGEGGDFY